MAENEKSPRGRAGPETKGASGNLPPDRLAACQPFLKALGAVEELLAQRPRPGQENPTENASSPGLTPAEFAACNQLIEALGKMDLSQEFKDSGLSVETAPDGTQKIIFPEQAGGDAFLNSALLQPFEAGDELSTSASEDQDMGLLDKHRICVFSEVTGIVTQEGKPVQGAEIIRRADLFLPQDRLYTDSTLTDAEGRFAFKPIYARRWKHTLSEVRTDQKLLVRHEDKDYLGWAHVTSGRVLHDDVHVPGAPEDFYIRLDFNGDLSRATPLTEEVDLSRKMTGEGFFNSQVVCVCSRLHFFVTMNGKPAVGAKIVRTAEHVGYGSYEQSKLSDRDGEVELRDIWAPLLVHRESKTEIRQTVVIFYEGKEYLAWEKTKTNPWDNGEYNPDDVEWGLYAEITAELTDDSNAIRGIKTDAERCGKSEYLPDDAIHYKGLFRITRFSMGYEK